MGDGHRSARPHMAKDPALIVDRKFVLKSTAPWRLKGQGILLIFKFSRDWVARKGHLPKHLKDKFKGGLGLILLTNYGDTPVGSFRELLFIPGKFRKTRKHAITTTITDTTVSAQNGLANWGIPKEVFPFNWETHRHYDRVSVIRDGSPIFSAEFETIGMTFPFSTAFFPLRICQTFNKMKYFTRLSGSGWGKIARVKSLEVNPAYFPDIRGITPLLAIKINSLLMRFPEPTYRNDLI